MSLFESNIKKARRALEEATSAHAIAVANLDAHRLAPADPGDAAAQKAWRRKEADLAQDVEIAEGVVAHWTGVVAKLEDEAAEKAADDEHAAMERRQTASAKRLRAIDDKFLAPLVRELEWVESEVQTFAEYNARRGNRPFIADPETQVRQIPGRTIPAQFEEQDVWQDGAGNQPTVYRTNADGELVPCDLGFTKKRVKVCVSPERTIPANMPPRLAELLPILRKALGR